MQIGNLILWWAPTAILVAIVVLFIWRKFYTKFPFFFAYVTGTFVANIVRYSLEYDPFAYFWAYWITDAICGLLALLALNEVFKHLFADYHEHWWFRLSLLGVVLVTALIYFFAVHPFGKISNYRYTNIVFSFDLGIHCLEVFILLLFMLLGRFYPAAHDQQDYGIVTGFGVSASLTIIVDLVRWWFGAASTVYFSYAPPVGFIIATLIWLYTFLRKEATRERVPITIRELLEQRRALDMIRGRWKPK